ncbi:hypothetical protein AUC71_10070 [Methyloceanibacter marginalis]|uniref:AsmA-like C-terminal domain-containing protein n=1 Tax=Methyloceanibacter marginalis TaxID=1774971 RepID=A0A1E3WC56_9HYPH|nr:hypothetical protein AUC71_10070 [Methyloceanibacter marginalis]
MNGAGTVDLPGQTLKFRVDPQLVASLEGQGGKKDMAGLGVPVMITGPWSHPKFYPDIKGILENPAEAYQRYKEFSKGVKNLPGLDGTGAGALSNVIKDGKVDKDALIGGIGGLLGGTQAAPTPETDAATTPEAQPKADKSNKKKSAKKKKNKQQTQKLDAEDAAKQLLDNFLTGQ